MVFLTLFSQIFQDFSVCYAELDATLDPNIPGQSLAIHYDCQPREGRQLWLGGSAFGERHFLRV